MSPYDISVVLSRANDSDELKLTEFQINSLSEIIYSNWLYEGSISSGVSEVYDKLEEIVDILEDIDIDIRNLDRKIPDMEEVDISNVLEDIENDISECVFDIKESLAKLEN